jgi:hypothetical protein
VLFARSVSIMRSNKEIDRAFSACAVRLNML